MDVGCGSGLFLQAMQEYGWTVHGVEPDVDASGFARETLGLGVITGDIFDVPSNSSYAAITFWDVLEHTHSPQKVLR
ncbi:MAG TPA: class I SAM-dependent methyltransferase, partial [Anaerolineae bacterium]|nr:class I SAM-dependent methyltransferase [Anaerolineae bacterium]